MVFILPLLARANQLLVGLPSFSGLGLVKKRSGHFFGFCNLRPPNGSQPLNLASRYLVGSNEGAYEGFSCRLSLIWCTSCPPSSFLQHHLCFKMTLLGSLASS